MERERIDKVLANAGMGSRQEVKAALKKGLVFLNGEKVTRPEMKINPKMDNIMFAGKPLTYQMFFYYMLHKPAGVVCAVKDPAHKTVLSLIEKPCPKGLFPVGRLDKDTEGLLLLTNDGELAHSLLSPKRHVDKTYYVKLDQPLEEEKARLLSKGLSIGDEKDTLPAKLDILTKKEVMITIQEGRYHQVKRMFQSVGLQVLYLKRISMGGLVLDKSLKKGEYRTLTEREIQCLKESGKQVHVEKNKSHYF
ncbi:MAG: rRNA pseudouridine synthase [Lachnospiraceae bacterium]|jgi:16S rRNA pseudouridine516 synthase|nr:rRNA pseudouridine synthase [Lachnospiraceae bacterium]